MYSSFQTQFAHLQIPLVDIKLATNDFAEENIIGKGGFGNVYKGKLSQSGQLMKIAVKRLNPKHGQGIKEFCTEISMLSRLKHENLVSIVGYCDEDGEKIIINKYEKNKSLDGRLSNPLLTWLQRLHICVGAARALSYVHYDFIIHRNIKSSKLLLDKNWEAKVCSFGLSVHTKRDRLVLDAPVGEISYIDPVYMKTGSVTHKSDVYSFGVILFEVLCGMKASIRDPDTSQYLIPTANQHYEEGKLDEIILPNLRNQMNSESLAMFSETAYHCLKEQRTQRPEMEMVAKRLEKAWELQRRHENPEQSESRDDGASSSCLREGYLEHLRIRLDEIVKATKDFHETYCIGSGGYGKVYKAELDYFDGESPLREEKNIKGGFPKRHGTVAIKRISREDEQGEQSFLSEIKLLTRCKHPNVISLLGFCDEGRERILVYEHALNGSLDDYFGNPDNMTVFSWIQRINMSLDIAKGLHYLHNTIEGKEMIIHRDIKSANVLLGKNLKAKIADFGLSRIQHENQQGSTIDTNQIAGTEVYLDPEYSNTGKLKKESDIYSFGVVLSEIMSGKVAYDESYYVGNDKGLPSVVRRFVNEGRLNEILDPTVKEETDLNSFTLNRGPNQESLDGFLNLAYQCLAENRTNRPTMKDVIIELENALSFQENNKDNLKISLEDIKLATQNFSDENVIGVEVASLTYRGEITHANGRSSINFVKRFDREFGLGERQFYTELQILLKYKHENVIGIVGYCSEAGEKAIVYEYASNKSLYLHLHSAHLSWIKRLEICIDVASVLEFFHGGVLTQELVIHGDITSSNILLTEDWKAKITGFGRSLISPINQEEAIQLLFSLSSTKEYDIYSFGGVLHKILSGTWRFDRINSLYITRAFKRPYEEGRFDEMVFADIKEQIVPNSLATFLKIAYQCLNDKREERPTAREVVVQLKKALDFQMDYELWEPKLPEDYTEIIQMSKSPEIYSTEKKEDLYNMFSNGILLQQGKVVLSFDGHGERNEMISATRFSYRNRSPHKWRSLTESRFHKVAEMSDLSDLMIKIKTKTQFLSPNVIYGVHLVFKFCDSRDFPSKPIFVNLKYRKGNETLYAYFATRRDNEWMMVELYRFLNQAEDEVFKFLIESLSTYYCRDDAIYVEGIEFRAIKKVEHEEIEVHQVWNSNLNVDQVQQILPTENEKLFSLSEVNGKKHLMLSAKAALKNFSDLKLYKSKPSTESRFQEVIELLPQQIFRMNCKIKSQKLSPDTEYACYLVFKLSEECQGLQCPVEVRNLLNREKEAEFIYFVSPNPWNLLDITRIPEQREDGWMEVIVWKFNSNQELKNDSIPVELHLKSYEGKLSGLIVCGLEFRPM